MAEIPLTLFDRLLDDNPDLAQEPWESEERALVRYKLGLRRDLEGLLNSKRPFSAWLGAHDGLGDTIVGFGLPDLSTEDFGTAAVRERIRRMIAACIRTHETRLSKVEVDVDGAPTSTGVRFRITAVLNIDAIEETVTYDAKLRPSDRAIAVELG
ncbi:MAG: type VI secretion system baseplate subunit TssE [Alphaproteobacteria bacterium]|nr:MAG: type VI secretion system baseplate subunit TssE [Alphaproteobacteria bacterium]